MNRLIAVFVLALSLGPSARANTDVYRDVFNSVSRQQLVFLLKNLSGVTPVTVGAQTFSISERYSPASKQKFRLYWKEYFNSLGIPARELPYTTAHQIGETQGHNLEAVLKGQSADSIVIIVHYDSMGPAGHEVSNPGADDDMTGMAEEMETARILSLYKGRLQHTVRFVAADYEEQADPGLEGARDYARYIKALSDKQGFKIVAAVDDEQIGWNCAADNLCWDTSNGNVFDVFSCANDNDRFNFPGLGDELAATAAAYSDGLGTNRDCMGQNSDHYAMWEIGVPAVVFSEHLPFNNPHFDAEGGDLFEKIDQNYFFKISQVGVTFAAKLAGIL